MAKEPQKRVRPKRVKPAAAAGDGLQSLDRAQLCRMLAERFHKRLTESEEWYLEDAFAALYPQGQLHRPKSGGYVMLLGKEQSAVSRQQSRKGSGR